MNCIELCFNCIFAYIVAIWFFLDCGFCCVLYFDVDCADSVTISYVQPYLKANVLAKIWWRVRLKVKEWKKSCHEILYMIGMG